MSNDSTRIWDIPVRLFHWTLVGVVAFSIYTGLNGGFNEMDWHMTSGYCVLGLITFRIMWGFAGSTYSRFSSFIKPTRVVPYATSLFAGDHQPHAGHNPLGALSVIAILLALLVQAGTGLFSNDDIMLEGPLFHLVSKDLSDQLTTIHHYNTWVIYGLIGLHVAAILFYEIVKRERLILAMITGRKRIEGVEVTPNPLKEIIVALILGAIAGGAIYYLINHV